MRPADRQGARLLEGLPAANLVYSDLAEPSLGELTCTRPAPADAGSTAFRRSRSGTELHQHPPTPSSTTRKCQASAEASIKDQPNKPSTASRNRFQDQVGRVPSSGGNDPIARLTG